MEDYIIDENLLKDIREPNTLPMPYPERYTKAPLKESNDYSFSNSNLNVNVYRDNRSKPCYNSPESNSNIQSSSINKIIHPSNNQLKKEMCDLESKYFNLNKLFDKCQKKLKDITEESKRLKQSNDSLIKECSLLQKTIERINAEKSSLLTQCEDSKAYSRKLESKVISGAKNQNLIEINNKLRAEIEEVNNQIILNSQNQDSLVLENGRLEKKIESLEHALSLKSKEMNLNNPNALLSYAETIERDAKSTNDLMRMQRDNELLKKSINELNEKLQELQFAKEHLTQLLVEKENNENALKEERDSIAENNTKFLKEKAKLKEYINHMQQEHSYRCDELNNYVEKINALQKELESKEKDQSDIEQLVSVYQQYKNENGVLKESTVKLEHTIARIEKEKEDLKKTNEDKTKELNEQIEEYKREKEDSVICANKAKDEIIRYQSDIVVFQKERDKYKKCLNDFVSCDGNKPISATPSKTIGKGKERMSAQQYINNTSCSNNTNSALPNVTMLDLVRKEKDKNRQILEEIRKLQEKAK